MRTPAFPVLALLAAGSLGAAGSVALADPGEHPRPMVLTARAGKVRVGEEKQTCHPVRSSHRREMHVNRIKMKVRGGSHHVHLYRPYNGALEYPPPDCPFAVDFEKWQLVAATQNPLLDWRLPPGVAIYIGPSQPLLIQTHFVNAGQLATKGRTKAKVMFYPMEPDDVQSYGGAIFAQDRLITVPPGRVTTKARCALTGEGADAHDLTIMAFTGHYHFRGVRFEVYRVRIDGTLGELLYDHEGYDDPPFVEYPPETPLVLAAGEGIEWWCTYQNDTRTTFEFGANTQRNEHCNLFGFYYPTQTPQEAIACIHMRDDQGNEQNVRLLAH
jgi:hypothetical protein